MAEIAAINKETFRAKVYSSLRDLIIAGELLPGEAITLRGLSKKFGVSVAPVREALVQLESEKIVLRRDNRDYRVNTLTRSQFDEVFLIRRMLEPRLGEQACLRRPEGAVDGAERILDAMGEAERDPKLYIARNRDFHFYLYGFAGLPMLLEIVNGLWARFGPYLSLNLQSGDLGSSVGTHRILFEAFARADPAAFNEAMLADMEFSYSYVRPLIGE
jgi:DNA-binding GntR family transcriptional regulator